MEDEIPVPADAYQQGAEEEMQDYVDNQHDQAEDMAYGGVPSAREPQGIWSFFNKILTLKDNRKVSNLDKPELGRLDLSVRNNLQLAYYGEVLHNKSYHDYFQARAENLLTTAMSKKGWLVETTVSQKRYSARVTNPVTTTPQKKPFLNMGGNKPQEAQQPQ